MAGRRRDSNSERNRECDANLNTGSFDSNAFVSLMNRLDPILKAFYSLSFIFCTDVNLATRLKDSILKAFRHLLNRDNGFFESFHASIAFLVPLLAAVIGFHFQGLGVSPLETHFANVLAFIMAAIVYCIAYMGIKQQPQGAEYLLRLRLIYLVSGIVVVELLNSIIISPFWQLMVHFLLILIIGVLCSYKQIYQFLSYTANIIFNAVPSLLNKINQLVCQIYDWLLQIFQSGAFQAFSSREREDNENRVLEMV